MKKLFNYKKLKNSAKDFSENYLPSTRIKQLFYYFKDKKLAFILLNILTFLFFIPSVAWHLLSLGYINNFMSLDASKISNELPTFIFVVASSFCLFLCTSFVGLSGLLYVFKELSYNEVINVIKDFFKGIKKNVKSFLIIGLITMLLIYIIISSFIYLLSYLYLNGATLINLIMLVSLGVLFFIVVSLSIISLLLTNYYVMSFSQLIIGAHKLLFSKIFIYLLLFIITFVPLLLLLLSSKVLLILLGYILLLIFYITYTSLIYNQVSLHYFDELINKENYPSYYQKGLKKNVVIASSFQFEDLKVDDTEDDFEVIKKE